jgi:hypothetical protein
MCRQAETDTDYVGYRDMQMCACLLLFLTIQMMTATTTLPPLLLGRAALQCSQV